MVLLPWLCVSLLVPYSLKNHAQLGGGSVAEILRSTLAYGWVEQALYKISNFGYFTSAILFTVNDHDEHVDCLYECMLLPLCMINNHVSVYVSDYVPMHMLLQCILFHHFMNSDVHGVGSPDG